jgi:hypothetical protein
MATDEHGIGFINENPWQKINTRIAEYTKKPVDQYPMRYLKYLIGYAGIMLLIRAPHHLFDN